MCNAHSPDRPKAGKFPVARYRLNNNYTDGRTRFKAPKSKLGLSLVPFLTHLVLDDDYDEERHTFLLVKHAIYIANPISI